MSLLNFGIKRIASKGVSNNLNAILTKSLSTGSTLLQNNTEKKASGVGYPNLGKFHPYLDFPNEKVDNLINDKNLKDGQYEYPSYPPPKESIIGDSEDVVYSSDLGITPEMFKRLKKKVLIVKRTVNMTSGGKIPSMSALVVVGNGIGAAGYAEGKGDSAEKAIKKATQRAIKNMVQFERYDKRTIYHDLELKFKATKLKLFARPPGFGVRTNLYIHEICQCIGITDLGAKVYGSLNPMNVIKCFFEALQNQRTPDQIAKARGKKLVDVQYMYYGKN
ncbi:hypothetical protein K502DRAFT_350921 [Neoconidiobolus thromboides FSU 785]|nr:hypothetical protein K502DRAFT_350921 [Neoconidiobolus thromboides FSU 785]